MLSHSLVYRGVDGETILAIVAGAALKRPQEERRGQQINEALSPRGARTPPMALPTNDLFIIHCENPGFNYG